ncbi:hypothetical protein ACFUCV_05170 [Specibacter sp. NPDC057265]|uniref:hypothetical protein n=1 Tax=Specibacter sp. NPDC057265 TaxID=3346075 RepID=UPI003641DE15
MQLGISIVERGRALLFAVGLWVSAAVAALLRRLRSWRPAAGGTRGDVPGWVLITLMSAVLVAGLLAIAGPALQQLFNQAMQQVQP